LELTRSLGFAFIGLMFCLSINASAADVVVVVSARNPVTKLSENQVVDLFLGKASRFPDGSQALPIDQVEGSPEREEFYQQITGKSAAQLKAYWSKIIFTGRGQPPRELSSGIEVRKFIAANPDAIGYIDMNLVDASVRVVRPQ
jgi:ABC-type phosphate transport system substrate-binding protein